MQSVIDIMTWLTLDVMWGTLAGWVLGKFHSIPRLNPRELVDGQVEESWKVVLDF